MPRYQRRIVVPVADLSTILVLAVGLPACVFRLWWIQWTSMCVECGLEHRACKCAAGRSTISRR
jgi:hypothetical protein